MVFSSCIFIFVFLPLILLLYYISPVRFRNFILFLGSLVFYSYGEPKYSVLIILSIFLNYLCGIALDKLPRYGRLVLLLGIVTDISLLFVFKYLSFSMGVVSSLLGMQFKQLDLVLPIGISFYTFQEISYLFDVYRNKCKSEYNFIDFGLYISMFPQLIAGPIVRFSEIRKEIKERLFTFDDFSEGIRLFIFGLGKKVLLANEFSVLSDYLWANSSSLNNISFLMSWLGTISFSFQIFFDFSGYSSMAIGLARMFGFHLPENFNYPYMASSVTDFWRRWHITLSQWFRDYVYIPMGGNREGKLCTIRNMLIVWLLTGTWHGAGWNFILWGGLFFIVLIFEKNIQISKRNRFFRIIYRILTLLFINFEWMIFHGNNGVPRAGVRIVKAMLGIDCNMFFPKDIYMLSQYAWVMLLGVILSGPVYTCIRNKIVSISEKAGVITEMILCSAIFLISVSFLVMGHNNPFIYFNF